MSDKTTRQTSKRDPLASVTDAFVLDLLRTAREHGIAEERERVILFLRDPEVHDWMGSRTGSASGLALALEQGQHDAGRTFPAVGHTEQPEPEAIAEKARGPGGQNGLG